MKKWSFIFLLISGKFLQAQDIHLSQFFETPLLRNPALAGIFTGDVRLQAVYRNQWQSIGYPYQTSVLSGEYKFPVGGGDDFMTIGVNFFYDVAGITQLKTLQVMPVLNYHKSLNGNRSSYLSAGFMAGYVQRSFDGKNITFDNQYTNGRYNPFASTGENFTGLQRGFFDIAAGLSYNDQIGQNGKIYFGGSLWHFTKPSANLLQTQIQLDTKWQLNAGYSTPVSDNLNLRMELNYLKEGSYTELIGGVTLRYSLTHMLNQEETDITQLSIGAGIMVRVNDAVIPVVQVSYNHFDFNFSYDVNTSKLRTASQGQGGIELGISYRAFTHNTNSTLNSVRCPRF